MRSDSRDKRQVNCLIVLPKNSNYGNNQFYDCVTINTDRVATTSFTMDSFNEEINNIKT